MPKRNPRKLAMRLVQHLLAGEELDRNSAAKLLDVEPPAAWDYIQAAHAELDGAVLVRRGRSQAVRLQGVRQGAPDMHVAVGACFAASLSSLFAGSSYEHRIQKALDYVVGASPRPERFADFPRKFFFVRRGGEGALPQNKELLEKIVHAVLEQYEVDLKYTHFDGKVDDIRLRPCSLVIYDHQLYLLGISPNGTHDSTRPLRFSRIKHVQARTSRTFEYPEAHEFHPQRLFAESFGIFTSHAIDVVEVRLHKSWSTYAVSHIWHPSQSVHVDSKGATVTMRVRVCPEVETWVLGFGEQAEVIRPKSLRRTIAKRVRAMARRYSR